jgi:hypothetical protein
MPQIQLTIILDTDTGSTSVNGPIDNQVLAYGMLQVARDAVYDRKRKAAESIIVQPEQGIIIP